MKINEIREKTDAELDILLENFRKERFKLKIQASTGQLENSARINSIRKDIARVKTELVSRVVK